MYLKEAEYERTWPSQNPRAHFKSSGYAQTSMEEIAKEVGITKPAIYHYFESKEMLFLALLDAAKLEHDAMLNRLKEKKLGLPQLIEEGIRQGIIILKENPDWIRLITRISSYPFELDEIVDLHAMDCDVHQSEIRLLEEAVDDMALRPGVTMEEFVYFFHDAIHAFFTRCVFTGQQIDEVEAPKRLRDLILFGACEKVKD